ncbi:MAG: fructose-bisphosphate aldolase [Nanoarchaeales archaeon]|nr:fructose-bisphosphate aldolase [Nanoarchaeales archaeon]
MSYREIEKAMKKLETKGKSLFLAQDQGFEHGPYELEGKTGDPDYIFEIAEKGKVDAFICQKGLAEMYGESYNTNIMLKVNGKVNPKSELGLDGDPHPAVTCSVRKAVDIGAKAIGFTNFVGSIHQKQIMEEFRVIQEDAHDFGLPVAMWVYPRGKKVKNPNSGENLAYGARLGHTLGADYLKMPFNGNVKDFKEQIRMAAKSKVVMSGGPKANSTKEFLKQVETVTECGGQGFAIGRNIWQHENPLAVIKAIRDIQLEGKDVYSALKRLE